MWSAVACFFAGHKQACFRSQDEVLRKMSDAMAAVAELMSNPVAAAANEGKINEVLSEIESLSKQVEELSRRGDFASKGDEQTSFQLASEYQDEMISTDFGYVRAWYVCKCGCVMSSKTWARRFPEFSTTGQRWYCISCNRRFKVAFGTICEMHFKADRMTVWSRANIWGVDIEELRGKYAEQVGLAGGFRLETPQSFYDSIKGYRPVVGTIFRPMSGADLWDAARPTATADLQMACMLTDSGKQLLDQQPLFDWTTILTLFSS